jgi:hypothetical protein
MKRSILRPGILLAFLVSIPPVAAQDEPRLRSAELMQVFHTISSHDLLAYAAEMSDAGYGGRLSGSPGYLAVAAWVASLLEEWGLEPYGDNGTWFQMFDNPYSEVFDSGALSVRMERDGEALTLAYSFPEDYFPGSNSDTGTVTGEVVYVGYGITAPELGYDDYAGLDVRGRIVVIDSGVPFQGEDDEFVQWVPYSYHQFKLDNAKRHGAAGLLYNSKIANPNTSFNEGLVYCHIDQHVTDHLFFGTGRDHREVVNGIRESLRPGSMVLGKEATITASNRRHPDSKSCNVIGLIRGSDPVLAEEVIVVGGHLDGVGYLGQLLPGALDNASGCADMLGAARALARSPVRPKRSIMFVFIGGEECGLLGSSHYCTHPRFPLEKTIVYFNLDMVGHGTGLSVGGGQTYPQIARHFEAVNDALLHRSLRMSASRSSVGRPRSDAVIFSRAGYRTMSFGTTGRVPGIQTAWHHPDDTIGTLTPEIMEDVAKLMFLGLLDLANDTGLEF